MLEDHRLSRREVLLKGVAGGLAIGALGEFGVGSALRSPEPGAAQARRQLPHRHRRRLGQGGDRRTELRARPRRGAPRRDVRGPDLLRPELQAADGPRRGVLLDERQGLDDQDPPGHRVPQRQDAHGRRCRVLDQADARQEARALRDQPDRRLGRSQGHQEDGQEHGAADAARAELGAAGRLRPVLHEHRARRLQEPEGGRQADRHGAVPVQELHARPALGAPAQPELLAHRPAVLRHGHGHRHPGRQRPRERADRRPGRRDRRDAVRAGREHAEQGLQDPEQRGWRLGADHDGSRPGAVQRSEGASGVPPDRRPPQARAGRVLGLRARRQRHLLAARRRPTTRRCRSASRTSTRRSRCSRPRARAT